MGPPPSGSGRWRGSTLAPHNAGLQDGTPTWVIASEFPLYRFLLNDYGFRPRSTAAIIRHCRDHRIGSRKLYFATPAARGTNYSRRPLGNHLRRRGGLLSSPRFSLGGGFSLGGLSRCPQTAGPPSGSMRWTGGSNPAREIPSVASNHRVVVAVVRPRIADNPKW